MLAKAQGQEELWSMWGGPRTVGGRALKVSPALTSVDPGSCLTILQGPNAKLGDPNFYPSSTTNWLCDTRMGRCAGLIDLWGLPG